VVFASSLFRQDINGLRALAVLPVLFFHAGLPFSSGGFLGVDVFFVISGFLITSRLVSDYQRGTFSIRTFYDNRIRRIVPALLVVVICSTVAALFVMLPYSLKNFGQSALATVLSVNNFLLYKTSGYWSTAAEFKPLYHTWSLGVEEQYYLLTPLLLLLLFRFFRGGLSAIAPVLGTIAVVSLVAAIVTKDREFVFLMLTTRAWELLAGALLAMTPTRRFDNPALSWVGIALLIFSYVSPRFMNTNQALVSLVPVCATCMVICFTSPNSRLAKILGVKPLAFIGLTSYSIYLWHQPLLAFARALSMKQPSPLMLAVVSLLSLPLAYVSWVFIENPARNRVRFPARVFYSVVIGSVAICAITGAVLAKTYGLQRLWPQYAYGENPQLYVDRPSLLAADHFHLSGKPKVLVVGNSFARDYINMLQENGLLATQDVVYTDSPCEVPPDRTLAYLARRADLVVFSKNWAESADDPEAANNAYACYRNLSNNTLAAVFLVGSRNFGWNNDFARTSRVALNDIRVAPAASVIAFNHRMEELLGPHFIDVLALVTDSNGAVPISTPDQELLTYDTNHLTRAGAKYVGSILFSSFKVLAPKDHLSEHQAAATPTLRSAAAQLF
jgi:peptidoglycan/LPS O-acetylase OafA/YrhL